MGKMIRDSKSYIKKYNFWKRLFLSLVVIFLWGSVMPIENIYKMMFFYSGLGMICVLGAMHIFFRPCVWIFDSDMKQGEENEKTNN